MEKHFQNGFCMYDLIIFLTKRIQIISSTFELPSEVKKTLKRIERFNYSQTIYKKIYGLIEITSV